ncbi:DUF4417 domain-containing protein [Megasphaera sp. UPII 135-E]|uniref:DUF4417 domain-containing protein n=1 Tax=Megasphaera sp. UPII 135-E TaxID=1000569 RepID=UPI00021A1978|nr:DUF4417 domain-containing protein [Megasphaera sp. UPII 135-E]EGS34114.1 hypothetical protein HMPREF1040_0944 [Megasphaera sp. UPII 135-E]MUP59141.1 DUF4417 domain-containing protein [Veillonellaceae bacterium M2-4]
MAKIEKKRKSCKDVYKSFLVEDAYYDGDYEIPVLREINNVNPKNLVLYSDRNKNPNKEDWICFYEDDYKINSFWNNPRKYLNILSKYGGIITPDYSLYRDMPLSMQIWNIFRSRALGYFMQSNGGKVVPNIRFSDERTYDISCAGVEKNSTIALSTHGLMKIKKEKEIFKKGLDYVIRKLTPKTLIIYGTTPDDIFEQYKTQGIEILSFESKISKIHKMEAN